MGTPAAVHQVADRTERSGKRRTGAARLESCARFSRRSDFMPGRMLSPWRSPSAVVAARRSSIWPISNPTRAGLPYTARTILDGLGDERVLTYEAERRSARRARAPRSRAISLAWPERRRGSRGAHGERAKLTGSPSSSCAIRATKCSFLRRATRCSSIWRASRASRCGPIGSRTTGPGTSTSRSVKSAVTERTRALVCVNPNNPTGSFLSRAELTELAGLGLPILSDEVFSAYAWKEDPNRAQSALELEDGLVIAFDGLSKLAALPQLKLAWIAARRQCAARRRGTRPARAHHGQLPLGQYAGASGAAFDPRCGRGDATRHLGSRAREPAPGSSESRILR